jgi:hypothetical protein
MSILPLLVAIVPYHVYRRSMQAMNAFVHAAVFCDGRGSSILYRWLHRSYRLISAPAAVVYHPHSLTPLPFCRQHFNYGRGAPRFRRVRDRRDVGARAVNPVTFYFNLLRHPYSHAAGSAPY